MFKDKNKLIDMTVEDYNLVIYEKDKIIETISNELDTTKEKLNILEFKFKNLFDKYHFNGYSGLCKFLYDYYIFSEKYGFRDLEELEMFVNKNINIDNVNINTENNIQNVKYDICDLCKQDIIEYNNYTNTIKEKADKHICINCFNKSAENNPKFNKNYKQCEYNIGNIYSCKMNAKNTYDNKNYCNIHYNEYINYEKKNNFEDESKNEEDSYSENNESVDTEILDKNNSEINSEFFDKNHKENNNINTNNYEKVTPNENIDVKYEKNDKKVKKTVDEIISYINKIDNNRNVEESNNKIINTIQKIEMNKLDKYKLMIILYDDLIKKNITKSNLFTKYIKENVLNDYIIILNDNKTRRIYNKCKKIYLINNIINIDDLYKLRIVNDILSLNKDEFNDLLKKLK